MNKYRQMLRRIMNEDGVSMRGLSLEIGISDTALRNFLTAKKCKLITIGAIYKYLKEVGEVA